MTLNYLIGKQYREQKKTLGGVRNSFDKLSRKIDLSNPQNEEMTGLKIGKNANIGHATVERAALFSDNLEKICENAGIKRPEILLGNIDATMKDVNDLADHEEPEFHKSAIDKVLNKEEKDLKRATSRVDKEYRDERARQTEEEEKKRGRLT